MLADSVLCASGAYFANSPREMGIRTADGTLLLIMTVLKGVTRRVSYRPSKLISAVLTIWAQDIDCRSDIYRNLEVTSYGWRGATVGILGMGNIGIRVADMATSLGMKVVYSNRRKVPNVPYEHMAKEEMYKVVDVLVVLTPLTDETTGMLNKDEFAKMRDGIMIVNVGESESRHQPLLLPAHVVKPEAKSSKRTTWLKHWKVEKVSLKRVR
jgi:phosphoglycerate dehydrogenase-like enzyme